jgi:C4-dicarboxylate-specific signal transduction histidine kinase
MRLGYTGAAVALMATQIQVFLSASHVGYSASDLGALQILMLVLSITGLLLGAVITEREHANLLLREQQAELARMSTYASAGAVGMMLAHEISQPLSTVATYVLAARRMLQSGASSEPVIGALKKAEAEAQRTGEMLERVRDFVSTGRIERIPLDLLDIAVKIRSLRVQEANAANVDVVVEGARPMPLVKADRIGIEQVLNNLVTNAIDAASERKDGRGAVTIGVAVHDDCVVVQVDDNGPGVVPEIVESMFEAYQTTKPRGMGLGLALSRQIVERHAGRLRWEPIAAGGARFVLALQINGPDENVG